MTETTHAKQKSLGEKEPHHMTTTNDRLTVNGLPRKPKEFWIYERNSELMGRELIAREFRHPFIKPLIHVREVLI